MTPILTAGHSIVVIVVGTNCIMSIVIIVILSLYYVGC